MYERLIRKVEKNDHFVRIEESFLIYFFFFDDRHRAESEIRVRTNFKKG